MILQKKKERYKTYVDRNYLKGNTRYNILVYLNNHYLHIRPLRCLRNTEHFTFEPRSRELLPKGFPENIPGICYFVNDYRHPSLPSEEPLEKHIDRAVEDLDE